MLQNKFGELLSQYDIVSTENVVSMANERISGTYSVVFLCIWDLL